MIEKIIEVGNLFDFYGKLLSSRQYYIIESFYLHDLSLTEIGEELNISRQGVFDTLKRAESNLFKYEEKLGLVSKFKKNNSNIDKIIELSNNIQDEIIKGNSEESNYLIKNINLIKELGYKILKNS